MATQPLFLCVLCFCFILKFSALASPVQTLLSKKKKGDASHLSASKKGPSYTDYSLDGSDWSVINTNQSIHYKSCCTVPGDIYTDLMNVHLIGEPFYRYNDMLYRWIAYENWTYSKQFSFPSSFSAGGSPVVVLIFDGVQAIANVYLNGQLLHATNTSHYAGHSMVDQFQQYLFDISAIVSQEEKQNSAATFLFNLTVQFTSSVLYATEKYHQYPGKKKPVAPSYLSGLPHRNFIRTEQSSFGWDWGPAFAPQGIYKSVTVRVFEQKQPPPSSVKMNKDKEISSEAPAVSMAAKIHHVVPHIFPLPFQHTVPRPLNDTVNKFYIRFYIYFMPVFFLGAPSIQMSIAVPTWNNFQNTSVWTADAAHCGVPLLQQSALGGKNIQKSNKGDKNEKRSRRKEEEEEDGLCFGVVEATIENVKLWWPSGYGMPTLHHVTASIHEKETGALLDEESLRVGVRSVELITRGDPLIWEEQQEKEKNSDDLPVMYFRINGLPIFAKGSNLVPFDAFQSRVNKSVMEDILNSALDAHMNMIRVWGGGLFPLSSFYDMADEKGIMLWQEMIFACAEYPIDTDFLWNVRREIRYQMRRIGAHSSLVVWSGNNENEIYDKGPGSPYEILDYDNVLATIIREDTSRPVWPSSPSRGFKSGVTKSGLPSGTMAHPDPFVVGGDSGDSHYYNYFSCPNVSLFPKTNFGSEYGFQSLPWLDNFAPVSEPKDWSLFSPLMHHRQHHPQGNSEISKLLEQNFQVPVGFKNSTALHIFRRVIYLSQLQQVLCIADEGSYYRRGRNMPYRTMGSLYWQLNQNWQAPSWTSIEYGGEWKILHYAMKDVYSPIHLSSYYNETTNEVVSHVASDYTFPVYDVEIRMELIPFQMRRKTEKEKYKKKKTSEQLGDEDYTVKRIHLPILPALSGVFYNAFNRTELLRNYSSSRCPQGGRDCFLYFTATIKRSSINDKFFKNASQKEDVLLKASEEEEICNSQSFWLTAGVKPLRLTNVSANVSANVNVTVLRILPGGTQAVLSVSTSSLLASSPFVSLYVMLRTKQYFGKFSHNGFTLIPGRSMVLTFALRKVQEAAYVQELTTTKALQDSIDVQTLNDMWV